jgi:hypothetical protein
VYQEKIDPTDKRGTIPAQLAMGLKCPANRGIGAINGVNKADITTISRPVAPFSKRK